MRPRLNAAKVIRARDMQEVELTYSLRMHPSHFDKLRWLTCVHRRLMFPWKCIKSAWKESSLNRFSQIRRWKSSLWLTKYLGTCSFIRARYRASRAGSNVIEGINLIIVEKKNYILCSIGLFICWTRLKWTFLLIWVWIWLRLLVAALIAFEYWRCSVSSAWSKIMVFW